MQPDSDSRSEILGRIWEARKARSIRYTPELMAELREFEDDGCKHEKWGIVRYRVNGGGFQARKCCLGCGDVFGGAVRPVTTMPDWNAGRLVMWVERRIAGMEAIFDRHARIQTDELTDMRTDHAVYLQSSEWRRRRMLVMDRAHGLCEGCRVNRPTQVHHLTYKHCGRELLFELVALCDSCHHLCHEDRRDSRMTSAHGLSDPGGGMMQAIEKAMYVEGWVCGTCG